MAPRLITVAALLAGGQLDSWLGWGQLPVGTPVQQGEALFPRYKEPK